MAMNDSDTAEETAETVEAAETETAGAGTDYVRKNELINLVVEQSGMKKRDVKPVVEATLAVLGRVLGEERAMNLPPFGKIRVVRSKDLERGVIRTLKLRQMPPAEAAPEALETSTEEG